MRSKLFVPGSRPELFARAMGSAADAVSFDLEAAVLAERKGEARQAVAAFLQGLPADHGKTLIVRVNAIGSAEAEADLAALVGVAGVLNLPNVEHADDVAAAAALLGRLEQARGVRRPTRLLVNIETPAAVRRAARLAAADARGMGLQTGYGDLFERFGIDRADDVALGFVRMAVRLAAAEAGLPAFDGAYPRVDDPAGFQRECLAARRHGFAGKSCIHPSQIALANACFLPTPAEIARAGRIVAAAEAARTQGLGACTVDGQMVDAPFLAGARATLALAETHGSAADRPG